MEKHDEETNRYKFLVSKGKIEHHLKCFVCVFLCVFQTVVDIVCLLWCNALNSKCMQESAF